MGHIRLGTLTATRRWTDLIELIAEQADVLKVAEAVTHAWEHASTRCAMTLHFGKPLAALSNWRRRQSTIQRETPKQRRRHRGCWDKIGGGGGDGFIGSDGKTGCKQRDEDHISGTHKPTDKLYNVHKRIKILPGAAGRASLRPHHLHVRAYKNSYLNKDYTQRNAVVSVCVAGATVSRMMGFDRGRGLTKTGWEPEPAVCAQVVGSTRHADDASGGLGRL